MASRSWMALQSAISRLEDEFRHVLIRNTMPLDADRIRVSLSIASNDGEMEGFESFDEDDQGSYCHEE